MILIYKDCGASLDCVRELKRQYKAQCVTADDLRQSDWITRARLLIMPGGRSLPFYDRLGETGNRNITRFVHQGGNYLGLCAGAYYACNKTIFAEGLKHELILQGSLGFFKGSAIGPVCAASEFEYHSERGARVVDIIYRDTIYPVYCNGGCYFEGVCEKSLTRILAWYNQKPIIICCQVGKGQAILSGVHPEMSYRTIPEDNNAHHHNLKKTLQSTEKQRIKLMNELLTEFYFSTP